MGEYISRDAAISKIRDEGVLGGDYDAYEREEDVVNTLKSIPAADVVEVRHGQRIQKGRKIYCSKCNRGVYIGTDDEGVMQDEMRLRHFCSACGAKMDGGQDDV